jgi:hypothetical protein
MQKMNSEINNMSLEARVGEQGGGGYRLRAFLALNQWSVSSALYRSCHGSSKIAKSPIQKWRNSEPNHLSTLLASGCLLSRSKAFTTQHTPQLQQQENRKCQTLKGLSVLGSYILETVCICVSIVRKGPVVKTISRAQMVLGQGFLDWARDEKAVLAWQHEHNLAKLLGPRPVAGRKWRNDSAGVLVHVRNIFPESVSYYRFIYICEGSCENIRVNNVGMKFMNEIKERVYVQSNFYT